MVSCALASFLGSCLRWRIAMCVMSRSVIFLTTSLWRHVSGMMYCIYIFFGISRTQAASIYGNGRPYVQMSGFHRGSPVVVFQITARCLSSKNLYAPIAQFQLAYNYPRFKHHRQDLHVLCSPIFP